jgi:hypothetical protein
MPALEVGVVALVRRCHKPPCLQARRTRIPRQGDLSSHLLTAGDPGYAWIDQQTSKQTNKKANNIISISNSNNNNNIDREPLLFDSLDPEPWCKHGFLLNWKLGRNLFIYLQRWWRRVRCWCLIP